MSHVGDSSPTSVSHVGDSSSTFASHVEDQHPAYASHAGGISLINASHTSDMSTTYAIYVGEKQPTTSIHARGIDSIEKPRRIGCMINFSCNLCKGDHLTHLFPGLLEVCIFWSLSARSSDYESSKVSSQHIHLMFKKVVMPMQSSADPTPFWGGDAPLDHVVSQPIQLVVEKVVMPMKYSVDPTLLLESIESTKVFTLIQSSTNPTLLLGTNVSTDYGFSISSSVILEQGGISNTIYRCIIDGSSTSILSSSSWKSLGSPELVSASHELLAFDIHPSEYLGILPQFPISLARNIFLVDVIVVQGLLDFNMLPGRDYVYAMNIVVSMLFLVMHFPYNGSIVTIDQLTSDNNHPNSVLVQPAPLYVPSVYVDSTPPQVNYVEYYPRCSIDLEYKLVHSCFPS
jgi:hypothetical protein